jgi:hypothetical protein
MANGGVDGAGRANVLEAPSPLLAAADGMSMLLMSSLVNAPLSLWVIQAEIMMASAAPSRDNDGVSCFKVLVTEVCLSHAALSREREAGPCDRA